ncbi:hypothetical protein G6L37_05225 [Agrobacterium rubi]|nr:hypothetical protein [Agrobacterium rubi]NTF24758.1 hypothetical protein [Agrobacterium rubi]
MTHWDQYNPWRDRLVYVPIEELAEALADGSSIRLQDGSVVEYTAELMLKHWRSNSYELDAYVLPDQALDAYILPNQAFGHSVGIRYGSHGHEYLSPLVRDQSRVDELYRRYVEAPALKQ